MQNNFSHAGLLAWGGGSCSPGPRWAGGCTAAGGCSQLPPHRKHTRVREKPPPAGTGGTRAAPRPGPPRHAARPAGQGRGAASVYGGATQKQQWELGRHTGATARPWGWGPPWVPLGPGCLPAPRAVPAELSAGERTGRGAGAAPASSSSHQGNTPSSHSSPGLRRQLRQQRGCVGLRAGAGTEPFLPRTRRGVAGVPPWPRSTGCPWGRPGALARGAAGIKPVLLPPLSSPRPPRATPRGGAACAPLSQTATKPKT